MVLKILKKAREDLRDVGHVITGHRASSPITQGDEEIESRKQTRLFHHQRARTLIDKQLETRYQKSCQKLVKNGAVVFSSEETVAGSATVPQADIIFDRLEKSLEYSGKDVRQGIERQIWFQELVNREYQPVFGLLRAPENVEELKEEFRSHVRAAKDGGTKRFFGEVANEIKHYAPPVHTTLPLNMPRGHSFPDGKGGYECSL